MSIKLLPGPMLPWVSSTCDEIVSKREISSEMESSRPRYSCKLICKERAKKSSNFNDHKGHLFIP